MADPISSNKLDGPNKLGVSRRDFLRTSATVAATALSSGIVPADSFVSANKTALHAGEIKSNEKLPYTVDEVINAFVDDQIITYAEAKILEPKLKKTTEAVIPPNADFVANDIPGLLYRDLKRSVDKGIITKDEAKFLLKQESMTAVSDLLSDLRKHFISNNRNIAEAKNYFKTGLVPKFFNVRLASN